MSVNEKMTAIADAIRSKTGGTEPLSLDAMVEAILGLGNAGVGEGVFSTGEISAPTNGAAKTIKHGLGVIPKHIVFFKIETLSIPASSNTTTVNKSIFSWLNIENGLYTYRSGYVQFNRFAYYSSASATSQSYLQRQSFYINSADSVSIIEHEGTTIHNVTAESFDSPTYLDGGRDYRWIAIA